MTWKNYLTCTRPSTWRGKDRPSMGPVVIRWIEANCVHTNGRWIGKPFRLLGWQKLLILALFAIDPATGLRLYRWALIGVAKKNGKTELAAALALFFLLGDGEPASLVVCAAASDDQADLVFGAARVMCELSSTLSQVTEAFDKEIVVTDPALPGCRLIRVAAAVGTNDGKNIHAVICDELHEWMGNKGEGVWNVLTNGTGARRQPMIVQITTAGYDVEGTICGQQYQHCKAVADGTKEDPTYFFWWIEAPDKANHKDPEVWRAVNPSFGLILGEAFYRDQLTKKSEAVFRRYFLNTWTESEEIWELAKLWTDLPKLDPFDRTKPIFVGIDMARRHDSCAVVVVQKQGTRFACAARIWENPYRPQDDRHDEWRFNQHEVNNFLRHLFRAFPAWARPSDGAGPAFFYDPNYYDDSAATLEQEGLNMIEFPQSDQRMIPASVTLLSLAKSDRLAHDHTAGFARQIRAVTPQDKPRGWRIDKPKGSRKKIDAAVAAAMACYEASRPETTSTVEVSLV